MQAVKAERIVLHGRVQGVGFRMTVADIARRHPRVSGTVGNAGYDRLEVHAEGDAADVDAFVADVIANAPPSAAIRHTERVLVEPRNLESFTVAGDRD